MGWWKKFWGRAETPPLLKVGSQWAFTARCTSVEWNPKAESLRFPFQHMYVSPLKAKQYGPGDVWWTRFSVKLNLSQQEALGNEREITQTVAFVEESGEFMFQGRDDLLSWQQASPYLRYMGMEPGMDG